MNKRKCQITWTFLLLLLAVWKRGTRISLQNKIYRSVFRTAWFKKATVIIVHSFWKGKKKNPDSSNNSSFFFFFFADISLCSQPFFKKLSIFSFFMLIITPLVRSRSLKCAAMDRNVLTVQMSNQNP